MTRTVTATDLAQALEARPCQGGWMARCPAHDDRKPSLSISECEGGILVHCHAGCSQAEVIAALDARGLWPGAPRANNGGRTVVSEYVYRDENGRPLFRVCRTAAKDFYQQRFEGGQWVNGLTRPTRRVLYNLPRVFKARAVYLCEGEKDADAVGRLGLVGTTAPGGAGTWRPEYTESLRAKKVAILPDNDGPGREHAQKVAQSLHGAAESVRIVELPGLPDKGDVSDWIAAGGTKDDLLRLTRDAPQWEPPAKPQAAEGAGTLAEWPEPEPLPSAPEPAAYDRALLPAPLAAYVADVAERMQVPADYPAAALLVLLGAVVGRRAVVQPKQRDYSWRVVPNLWGGIVGPPGRLKTPILNEVSKPLKQVESQWREEHAQAMLTYRREYEAYDAELKVWRRDLGKGKAEVDAMPEPPEEPAAKRLILSDTTFEKLHAILVENPAGVLLLRDELTGWLTTLDREDRAGTRQFFLESWSGDSFYTLDRIGRGSLHVPHNCVSVFGGIQPGRLRSYVTSVVHDRGDNDGLLQRFQILVWPEPAVKWDYVDAPPSEESAETIRRLFCQLWQLPSESPRLLKFEPDAQELFVTWLSELEREVRSGELPDCMTAHLAKYRSLMPTLAALFALAAWAAGEDGEDGETIGVEHARRAAAWCAYLRSHAERVYGAVLGEKIQAARRLLGHLRAGRLGQRFSLRDVYRPQWSGLTTAAEARAACETLCERSWLRRLDDETGGPGRPTEVYLLHPAAQDQP